MKVIGNYVDFFLSPVTGRLYNYTQLPPLQKDYIWVGDQDSYARPSPALIDVRLDIIDLQYQIDNIVDHVGIISYAKYIIQEPEPLLPNAQALNTLVSGMMSQTGGVVHTTTLSAGKLWIGDVSNFPAEALTITIGNLPILSQDKLWVGDSLNRPAEVTIIKTLNLPNLTENYIWVGDSSNRPVQQPLSSGILPDLSEGKIWIGNDSNRPEAQSSISQDNLPGLTRGSFWKGNEKNRPTQVKGISQSDLPNLKRGSFWKGNESDRPEQVKGISMSDLPDLAPGFIWVGGVIPGYNINRPTASTDLIVINGTLAGLQAQLYSLEATAAALTASVGALQAELVVDMAAPFIVQKPKYFLPNAQALSDLDSGMMSQRNGVVYTTKLSEGRLWLGNSSDYPSESQTILPQNLPNLSRNKLWTGDASNRPSEITTIQELNLPNLTENYVWVGNSSNRPVAQPISSEILPNLSQNKLWIGDASNRPIETTTIEDLNLPDINENYIWVGNSSNRPIATAISISTLPDLSENKLWAGNSSNRPSEITKIQSLNLPDIDENYIWVGNGSNRPVAQALSLDIFPDLTNGNIWIGNGSNRPVESSIISDITGTVINLIGDVTGSATFGSDISTTISNTSVTPGSYTYASFTVNSQGRLTAASSGSNPVLISGSTMTGPLILNGNATSALQAVTKQQLDALSPLSLRYTCNFSTTSNLVSTYNNGSSGVGATLTNAGTLAAFVCDGTSPPPIVGDLILVQFQTNSYENGLYVVTILGSGSVAWVLTRYSNYDEPAEIKVGDLFGTSAGATYQGWVWLQTQTVTTIGTSPISFIPFYTPSSYFLTKSNNLSDLSSASTARTNLGLTNVSTQNVTNHSILIGGSSNSITSLSVPTASDKILASVANSDPAWTSTLPSAVQGNITSTGTITSGTWASSTPVGVQYGGTGSTTLIANSILLGNGTSAISNVSVGASGTVLVGNTSSAPTFSATPSGLTSIGVGTLSLSSSTLSASGDMILSPGSSNSLYIGGTVSSPVLQTQVIFKGTGNNKNPGFSFYTSTAYPVFSIVSTSENQSVSQYYACYFDGSVNRSSYTGGRSFLVTVNSAYSIYSASSGTAGSPISFGPASFSISSSGISLSTITTGTWNGSVIGLSYGGSNAALTASNGGIVYSTASAMAILAGTATAGQILRSGSSAAPSWSTATYPSTTTINRILYSSATNTISEITTANNGILITSSGGVPSISSTLPSAVQNNITTLGILSTETKIGSTTDSSSYTVGALTVAGGVGITKRLNVNDKVSINGETTINANLKVIQTQSWTVTDPGTYWHEWFFTAGGGNTPRLYFVNSNGSARINLYAASFNTFTGCHIARNKGRELTEKDLGKLFILDGTSFSPTTLMDGYPNGRICDEDMSSCVYGVISDYHYIDDDGEFRNGVSLMSVGEGGAYVNDDSGVVDIKVGDLLCSTKDGYLRKIKDEEMTVFSYKYIVAKALETYQGPSPRLIHVSIFSG